MNDHWMDLCKSYVFCADRKFKMAAISGDSFNIGPYGNRLKNYSSETGKPIQSKLCMNDHWMHLYKSYVFCADRKFKMAAIHGHSFNIGPYGKMLKNFFF